LQSQVELQSYCENPAAHQDSELSVSKTAFGQQVLFSEKLQVEHLKYGKAYLEEAKRIVTHLPQLPSKFVGGQGAPGHLVNAMSKQRVPSDQLMRELEDYLNLLIEFSPLICNLFYLREFLVSQATTDRS
jgi:hypothetical protein